MNLVIVESPAKAKTIRKFLGRNYQVKASMGHLVDLPKSQLGVDLGNNFQPKYITIRGKGKILQELKEAGRKAARIYLASDHDREGEAISWHLGKSLSIRNGEPCRVVFNEITKEAIKNAFAHPRYLDINRVDAQQARRILDRLVGYMISPLLWEKVQKGLSAGRVQSVALRLICDREREIEDFKEEEYWSIEAKFLARGGSEPVKARFFGLASKRITFSREEKVKEILKELQSRAYIVHRVQVKERKRNPSPPFTTSTLQQEASRRLGFSAKKTMMLAQQLYEGLEVGKKKETTGLITYIRTDATRVSTASQEEARRYIEEQFGKKFLPEKPPTYAGKKGAQEAHEAIRPTSVLWDPATLQNALSRDQLRLYRLIWERFLASQMAPALLEQVSVDIKGGDYIFKAGGTTIKFPGFLAFYKDEEAVKKEEILPPLQEGETLDLLALEPLQHFTQPPPRYTEASLVKAMENKGIGRPSTYAPTIETLKGRGYVVREEKVFKPTELGFVVIDLLKNFFPEIIDVDFTARLEDRLDMIEAGEIPWLEVIRDFYHPFQQRLQVAAREMQKVKLEDETGEFCPLCSRKLVKKFGRYGSFFACSGFPDCRFTKQPHSGTGVKCPHCDGEILERRSKKGRLFYGCSNYPQCSFVSWDKPLQRTCPQCEAYLVEKKGFRGSAVSVRCSNKECTYQEKAAGRDKQKK
ncbi:MAG: type I DNA topoisomerase [Bacillota bacterium]